MTDHALTVSGLRIVAREASGAERALVDNVDLQVRRGEILGLIGESGAGKSTIGLAALAFCRTGCVIADGKLVFDGVDLRQVSAKERRDIRGRRIAYVAQSAAASFNPAKTLFGQVCEPLLRHGVMKEADARKRAIELFRELDLPSPETFGNRYPHQVSGGQLQRAMVAMAMSCRPDVIVFDEPTTALDVTTQIGVLAAIRKLLRNHDTAGLYITHDLAVVAQVAHQIMVLRDGRMVELGSARQVLRDPQQDYTRRLVSVRAAAEAAPRPPRTVTGEIVLECHSVSGEYSGVRVVKDASLSIESGETVAVVGESGSGKSTLARLICGLRPLAAGEIKFQGVPLPPLRRRSRDQLRRIQLIYQTPDTALNPRQKVGEILGRPLAMYFGMPAAKGRARVADLLRMVDLPADFSSRLPASLSGGEKQRVCIARALAAEPDLIVCDEVTSSLDSIVADDILNTLQRLQREAGIAYLFISHDLGTVRRMADRVALMLRGEIVVQGPTADVFAPPYHPYTELLLSSVPEMRVEWLDELLARKSFSGRELAKP